MSTQCIHCAPGAFTAPLLELYLMVWLQEHVAWVDASNLAGGVAAGALLAEIVEVPAACVMLFDIAVDAYVILHRVIFQYAYPGHPSGADSSYVQMWSGDSVVFSWIQALIYPFAAPHHQHQHHHTSPSCLLGLTLWGTTALEQVGFGPWPVL